MLKLLPAVPSAFTAWQNKQPTAGFSHRVLPRVASPGKAVRLDELLLLRILLVVLLADESIPIFQSTFTGVG